MAPAHPLKSFGHPKAHTSILERIISIDNVSRLFKVFIVFALTMLTAKSLVADPVPVRRTQGTFHGFLVLKTQEGKTIASGDLIQVGHGDRVTARMTFRFRDGSIDDETTVFSQGKVFQLISDHHIQRGPSFPHTLDMLVDTASGDVTYHDKDGKAAQDHFDLPNDVCNGLPLILLLNQDPLGQAVRLAMVAPTSRPRLIHVVLAADGDERLSIGGIRQKATNYRIRIELGGVEGVVAPIIGKQLSDIHVWILGGEAPAFVREEGQFYEGGPVWRIELVAPIFPGVT
jgi:hypothetical protein